ncbi:methyltransferase [Labilibacter sediminis]|nr:methyltransferase [Labilibacter sediminis]
MANTYFSFKEFIVHQDKTAMKVGTDGVLLGAWANCDKAKKILDIGSGTGLISLMLAQRTENAAIDAIEIDDSAFGQMQQNFELSPWKNRLTSIHMDFKHYSTTSGNKYELIVSNPPFFINSLKNECNKKSLARHTDSLSFAELISGIDMLLAENGIFCVILPATEKSSFIELAKTSGLNLTRCLYIKPTPSKPAKRILMEFSLSKSVCIEEEIIIEDSGRHGYSNEYKELTKDFYLAF